MTYAPQWLKAMTEVQARIERTGRPPSVASVMAKQIGISKRRVLLAGLHRPQTELAWLCRYNEMRRMGK